MLIIWLVKAFIFFSTSLFAVEGDVRFDILGGGAVQQPLTNSVYNPGNQFFQFTDQYVFVEMRPDLELTLFERLRLVVRPKFRGTSQSKPIVLGAEPKLTLADSYVNEAFAEMRFSDYFQFSVGRQNYQWGPAESLTPTSFFFPDLTFRVEPYYEIRGRTLARANISFFDDISLVLMGELNSLNDQNYESPGLLEDLNEERAAAKLEYTWDSGAKNFGLVAGKNFERGFYGFYTMLTANEDWQVYADMLGSEGSATLYPTGVPSAPLAAKEDTALDVQGVLGLRYTFKSGAEWRVEFLFNQSGYSVNDQIGLKALFAVNPLAAAYWSEAQRTSLLGQNYIYSSIRQNWSTSIFKIFHQPVLAFRLLQSLIDESIFFSGSFETGVFERGTLYSFGGFAVGKPDQELRRGLDSVLGIAYRHSLW